MRIHQLRVSMELLRTTTLNVLADSIPLRFELAIFCSGASASSWSRTILTFSIREQGWPVHHNSQRLAQLTTVRGADKEMLSIGRGIVRITPHVMSRALVETQANGQIG